jgi:hypothetical protein
MCSRRRCASAAVTSGRALAATPRDEEARRLVEQLRALADAELDRWRAVVSAVTPLFRDVWAGLEYAVAGMLASPGFL